MKRIRWKLIERFWPRGGDTVRFVPARRSGSCSRCGRCCALIRLPTDLEFFEECRRRWNRWSRGAGEEIPANVGDAIRDTRFILENWARVPRDEVVRRGFRPEVVHTDFFYHCLRLTRDGLCGVHGMAPGVCSGYPFYGARKARGKRKPATVFQGCGYADRRFKGKALSPS